MSVRVTVVPEEGGSSVSASFSGDLSLWGVLTRLESASPKKSVNFTRRFGVPPSEDHALFRVQYNVKGYMAPVLALEGGRSFSGKDELKATRLRDVVGEGEGQSFVALTLSHVYQKPDLDDATSQLLIDRLKSQLLGRERDEKGPVRERTAASPAAPASPSPPATRPTAALVPRDIRVVCPGLPLAAAPARTTDLSSQGAAAAADGKHASSDGLTVSDFAALVRGIRSGGRDGRSSKSSSQFPTTRVRFRMPGRVHVDASFGAHETAAELSAFVRGCLHHGGVGADNALELFTTPPRTVLRDPGKTLAKLGLVPSALVWVTSDALNARVKGVKSPADAARALLAPKLLGVSS